jgi:chromosome partitioning protein
MHIDAVINQKGGVAKTTTSVNLASITAAELGRRVLLVDLDPQGQSSLHLGLKHVDLDCDSPAYEVLVRQRAIADKVQHTPFGFDLLAAGKDLAAAQLQLAGNPDGAWRLREALEKIPEGTYDVVLIDCPPALDQLSFNALVAATSFLVPIVMQAAPLAGFGELLDTVASVRRRHNPDLSMIGVLGCNTPKGSRLSDEVRATLVAKCGAEAVFPREIRYSEYLARGFDVLKPVNVWAPGTIGHDDYLAAANEMVARGAA